MRASFALLALIVTISIGGCTQSAEAPDEPTEAAPSETPAGAPGASAGSDLPADQTGLSLQANHPSGSVLRVTGLRFREDHVALDLAFTNGADFEQELNNLGDSFVLRDDLSNVYRLSPPPANSEVRVAQGTTMEGEFVFLGRLNPQATRLTVLTNEEYGGGEDFSRDPRMVVDIPLSR